MILRELQILSEALWESVKTDLEFFSSIQFFCRKLSEYNFSELTTDELKEIEIYMHKIVEFFDKFRPNNHKFGPNSSFQYFPPRLITRNSETVDRIQFLFQKLSTLNPTQLSDEIESVKSKLRKSTKGQGKIFIGHGRNKIWARLQVFLQDELRLQTLSFESESRTGESIVNILSEILDNASFAILVMTAEDETGSGRLRARQNVVHESGLFQGRLGFQKVVILKEDTTEEFSNIAGLQYIPFTGDNIEQTFYELQKYLKKHGLLN